MSPTHVTFKIRGKTYSPEYKDAFTLMEYLASHHIKFDVKLSSAWLSIVIEHDKGTLPLPFRLIDGASLLKIDWI